MSLPTPTQRFFFRNEKGPVRCCTGWRRLAAGAVAVGCFTPTLLFTRSWAASRRRRFANWLFSESESREGRHKQGQGHRGEESEDEDELHDCVSSHGRSMSKCDELFQPTWLGPGPPPGAMMPGMSGAAWVTRFKDRLRVPPVLRPTPGGHGSPATLRIWMQPGRVRPHSELPPSDVWTYEGHLPGQ